MAPKILAFTVAKNETVFLPAWVAHHERMGIERKYQYVLDHGGNPVVPGVNYVPIHREKAFDHRWLVEVVTSFQNFLLRSARYVLFSEADEFIAVDKKIYKNGLYDYFSTNRPDERCKGFELIHLVDEAPIDFSKPLLSQRRGWSPSALYSKQAVVSRPYSYSMGFHSAFGVSNRLINSISKELILIHCHRVDYEIAKQRHIMSASQHWNEEDVKHGFGSHNRMSLEEFDKWFYSPDSVSTNYEKLVINPTYQWDV